MDNLGFFLQDGSGSLLWTLLPFVLIFGIFYFLVILPQKRKQQETKEMINYTLIESDPKSSVARKLSAEVIC